MKFLKSINPIIYIVIVVALIATTISSIFTSNSIYLYLITIGISLFILFYLFFSNKLIKEDELTLKESKNKYLKRIKRYISIKENRILLLRQIVVVCLAFIFLIRYYLGHDYLENISQLNSLFMHKWEVAFSAILSQWWIGAIILIAINEFAGSSVFKTLVKYISTPIIILSFIFFPQILMGICGDFKNSITDPRLFLMAIELGLAVAFVAYTWIKNSSMRITKEERQGLLIGVILLLITSINDYMPKVFFGESVSFIPLPLDVNWPHRVYIYITLALPILYFIMLYRYDYKHRRVFLIYIAVATLFAYSAIKRNEIWTNPRNLQLHLCNTAMFIIPITLIFKTTKIFYFTMFINVIGAILALLMPNYNENLGAFSNVVMEFFINHLYASFMPILIVLLGVYERPKIKYFTYSMIGFLFYFILVLILNSFLGTDYFFINSNFIVDKLGKWAEDIFKIELSFEIFGKTITFHPVYQSIFFAVYVGFAFGMWYVYELLFKVVDSLTILVEKNKIYEKSKNDYILLSNERGSTMKDILNSINYESLEAKLKIEHLQKRYGNNSKNTVEDFSLELNGGKIYGFLGKNGAGKSTIIKSIVGMHTFNSGTISVCGFDVEHQPIEAKSCIGFVPDNYALYENLTGRQYINYIADLYNVSKKDRKERLADLLPRLELEDKFDRQMKTYSHGMKQKITIIGALVHDPKIWILDEPMTGVDPNSIFQIKECMREHAKKGNIVFFSSHLIDVVSNLCDDVIMIRHGEFILQESLKDLKEKNIDLETLFLEKTADSEEEAIRILNDTGRVHNN